MSALERLPAEALAVLVALCLAALAGHHYGAAGVRAEWDRDKLARAGAATTAVVKRVDDNKALATQQAASNSTITKVKNEELAPVRERIVTQRVYVGTAVCGDRPAGTTEAESPAGGDGANPPGRLVRPDVERDLVALKLAVEEDLATGRACQAFLDKNALVP